MVALPPVKVQYYHIARMVNNPKSNTHSQLIHAANLAVAVLGTGCTGRRTSCSWCNLLLFHQDQPAAALSDL
jgi:hypothetical protein